MDMVGNLDEMVADWMQGTTAAGRTPGPGFGNDAVTGVNDVGQSTAQGFPGTPYRGGFVTSGDDAGVFGLDTR